MENGKPDGYSIGKMDVTLAEARAKAEAIRAKCRDGNAPIKQKPLAPVALVKVMTFEDVGRMWHDSIKPNGRRRTPTS